MMIKKIIVNKNYNFRIAKIKPINEKIVNLVKRGEKENADNKFLEKLKKIKKNNLGNFIFLLRSLDFRLWEFPENWVYKVYKKEKGFFGLMERAIGLFKVNNKDISFSLFRKIISPKEGLSLARLRYKVFKDSLRWLKNYDGNFDNYFEENKKAYDFCFNLFDLEKFRDFYKNFYFLKPNQLLYLEYILGKNLFKNYKDELEDLTIFADYKLPQIFINFGLIELPKKYLEKLKEGRMIRKFSLLENELRFASILLGEEISKKLKIPSYRVDNILWALSHKIKLKIPAPKVKTIFY